MSERRQLVLNTRLYSGETTPSALDHLSQNNQITNIAVNPKAMKPTDWDQILEAICDHDQCITL